MRRSLPLWLCCLGLALACRPTVALQAPDEPIVLNINVTVQQEVRVRLEDDVKRLLDAEDGVSTRDVDDPVAARGGELFASEPEVDSARVAGTVGERYDGLLDLVRGDADAATRALVDSVNTTRLAAYTDIAAERAAPLADVRALAAKARIEGAPPGTFVMLEPGVWRRR